jgi:hypothetical protein
MRGRRLQVYLHLCFRLDVVQYRPIKLAAESRTLGMGRPNLSQVLHHLVARGYLHAVTDAEDRRRQRYRLKYSLKDSDAIPPP